MQNVMQALYLTRNARGLPASARRYINSAALRFVPYEKMEAEGYGYLLYLFEK